MPSVTAVALVARRQYVIDEAKKNGTAKSHGSGNQNPGNQNSEINNSDLCAPTDTDCQNSLNRKLFECRQKQNAGELVGVRADAEFAMCQLRGRAAYFLGFAKKLL